MEIVIQTLILLVFINCIIKLSFWRIPFIIVFTGLIAIFILVTTQFAITESKVKLLGYLNDKQLMRNVALLVTVEAILSLSFCFISLQSASSNCKIQIIRVLKGFISLLIFPGLYYTLVMLVFLFPGCEFWQISLFLSLIVISLILLLSIGIKYLVIEKELKLEIHFIVSLFIVCLGLLMTADGVITTSYVAESPTSISTNLLCSLMCIVVLFLLGVIWEKIKWRYKNKI